MSEISPINIAESPEGDRRAVRGQPRVWLRLEGAAALILAVAIYAMSGHSWVLFAILFLAPDIAFIAYLAGPAIGGGCYNVVHTYVCPIVLGFVLHVLGISIAIPLIWVAHIGMDRALGYGLKYPDGFAHAHLGCLGKQRTP
jgi:hypothetical protein